MAADDVITYKAGRKPRFGLEFVALLLFQLRAELYPRTARFDAQTEITLSRCCTFSDGLFSVVDEELLQSSNDAPDLLELSLQFQEFLLRDVLLVLGDT